MEWEKSGRGTDGRIYPWGNHFDISRCCNRHSSPTRQIPSSIYKFPVDCSPYGVLGLAGNASDWCLNHYLDPLGNLQDEFDPQAERTFRGGSWISPPGCTLNKRFGNPPNARGYGVSFRICRSVPKKNHS